MNHHTRRSRAGGNPEQRGTAFALRSLDPRLRGGDEVGVYWFSRHAPVKRNLGSGSARFALRP
ncbi:hypothetical protein FLX56_00135 [Synechococcus moorigangaii CMS01]|nr:hypothetical protein [Synechococcus moorigangaii CMS01]